MPETEKDIAVLQEKARAIEDCNERIKKELKDAVEHKLGPSESCREAFVSRDRFWPIEKVVYGLVGLILTGVVGAIIALVIKR
jgi:hypothetical protein